MSLDLYLKTKEKKTHKGTGVFIRENGSTRELTTIEEVQKYFPSFDTSNIRVEEREDDVVWNGNITHNLVPMALIIKANNGTNLYQLLWHPNENGFDNVTPQYTSMLCECLKYMITNKMSLIPYSSVNKWGTYEQLKEFVEEYISTLKNNKDEELKIIAST